MLNLSVFAVLNLVTFRSNFRKLTSEDVRLASFHISHIFRGQKFRNYNTISELSNDVLILLVYSSFLC